MLTFLRKRRCFVRNSKILFQTHLPKISTVNVLTALHQLFYCSDTCWFEIVPNTTRVQHLFVSGNTLFWILIKKRLYPTGINTCLRGLCHYCVKKKTYCGVCSLKIDSKQYRCSTLKTSFLVWNRIVSPSLSSGFGFVRQRSFTTTISLISLF